ncbi:carboxypeptidase N subunit 2-like isoform X1 [Branchiostoma floridae]|uniref:Carboxypeptidase N subunit 2-like isoform X1 n=2 Tax=Branchiostoma floridae TaxID=7739 RepID=A0A9J7HLW6_BRAFL|nr:carboxypeptidase N subunit 2-like isoform X1 [Branchiostoma floridae]
MICTCSTGYSASRMPLVVTMLIFWVISMLTLIPAHACPSECVCLLVGDARRVHCDQPTLEHIPQGIPNSTTLLQMKGTKLVSVRRGDLAGLPLLRTLYLSDNQIQTIEVGAFDNNPDIQDLGLYNNNMSDVLPGVFRGLNSLGELDMRTNKFTSIPAGVFNGLPRLRVVRLYENRINTIAVGAFSNLSSVELFNFGANRLTRIANGVFGSPQGATALSLHENNILVIEPGALSNFVRMSRLYIYSNRLSTLQGVFQGLSELTEVDAHNNTISALNEGDFSGLTKLREINLNNNKISTIAGRVFANLSSLQELQLQDNEISSIGNDTFYGLFFGLRKLYLSGNKLETVTGGVFANLFSLAYLELSNNKITRMEARLPLGLRSLFLKSNALTGIPTYSMDKIQGLDLSFNPIVTVRNEDLLSLSSLTILNLSGIKYFLERGDVDPEVFKKLDNIAFLALGKNNLTRVPTSALRHVWRLVYLDLSGNNFTKLEYGDFDNLTNIQDLDLSGNRLTTVPREALANLSSLRSLDLSDNPIVYVGPHAFGPQLVDVDLKNTKLRIIDEAAFNSSRSINRLTLSNNYLQYLPANVFQPLTSYRDYESLALAGNPWVCDCQLAGFVAWLKTPNVSAILGFHCISPPSLEGYVVRDVPTNRLNCSCVTEESPRIDTGGSTAKVPAGDTASLPCKVNACPGAAILWTTPRGLFLTSDSEWTFPKMYILADGTLVIAAVTAGDAGLYTCMAVNAFGTAEARVVLNITATPPAGHAVGIHTSDHFIGIFTIVLFCAHFLSDFVSV